MSQVTDASMCRTVDKGQGQTIGHIIHVLLKNTENSLSVYTKFADIFKIVSADDLMHDNAEMSMVYSI